MSGPCKPIWPSVQGFVIISLLLLPLFVFPSDGKRVGEINIEAYREKVKRMFYHAYEGYLNHAYPYDELQPLTCTGHDTWGSYSLTLIDALDTLAVMGNYSEFRRISNIIIEKGEGFFDMDINVSVFETNIRIVGGLLSAHLMMKRAGMVLEPAWPCSGPLLRMADNIARKILPAFDTPTGMPYGTVNLRHGVPKGETTVTCTAGVGTFLVEFGALSRLTGDPIFEKTAMRAIRALWKYRSPIGLLGNHVDVSSGRWTALDSGIGGGIDSYFEYLVKGAILLNMPELIHMFREYEVAIDKYMKRDDWYMWAHMTKGSITLPVFTSLDGYWPSIKGMLGELDEAMKTIHNFHQVWRQFGFTPEYYNIPKAEVHQGREGYPLRPEIVESVMYLYRATKDPYLLEIGVDVVEAIEHSAKTSCGYATVKDVRDHRLEDRMESFFLAETTKYLYLLFDPDNFIHNNGSHGDVVNTPSGKCVIEAGGYVFNTEAHPLDLAAIHCCSAAKKEEDHFLQDFHDNLDLLQLLDLDDKDEEPWVKGTRGRGRRGKKKNKQMEKRNEDEGESTPQRQQDTSFSVKNNGKDIHQYLQEKMSEGVEEDEEDDEDNDDYSDFDKFDELEKQEKLQLLKEEQQKKVLQVVDMTTFTEMERNLTRQILEDLKIDTIMKNISAHIAQRLEQEFKDTEHERMAKDIGKKILQASESRMLTDDKDKEREKTLDSPENEINDEKLGHSSDSKNGETLEAEVDSQAESGIREREGNAAVPEIEPLSEDAVKTSQGVGTEHNQAADRKQVILVQVKADGSATATSQDIDQDDTASQSQGSQDGENNTEKQDKDVTTEAVTLNPAIAKFKTHLEDLIQQQQEQSQQTSQSGQPAQPATTSPLENKRQNLMSITTKILNMISGSSTETAQDSEPEKRGPSVAGLYASLANYPMKYFYDPATMHCPAQPFHSRVSVYGEMFPDQ